MWKPLSAFEKFTFFVNLYPYARMYLIDRSNNLNSIVEAIVEPVRTVDLQKLTKRDFIFDWSDFEETQLWKLRLVRSQTILGAMSLTYNPIECRIEINLITSRRDNIGSGKRYDRIAGCLIGWTCRLAVELYGDLACVSLRPKTNLIKHYRLKYGMLSAGQQLFVDGQNLYNLIQIYIDHEP